MPDISGSTILVTGGSGLIGSHTIDHLINENIERVVAFDKVINERNLIAARKSEKVKIVQGDVSNPGDIDSSMEGVDFVFHFAGILLLPSSRNPRECLINNINGMFNLLEIFIKRKVKRLIYSSSVAVYAGNKKKDLMKEDQPLNSRNMYGTSKIIGEQFCRVFNESGYALYSTSRKMQLLDLAVYRTTSLRLTDLPQSGFVYDFLTRRSF